MPFSDNFPRSSLCSRTSQMARIPAEIITLDFRRNGRRIHRSNTLRRKVPPFTAFSGLLGPRNSAMQRERKPVFDPKAFLAKANGGRTISQYRKDQVIFSQGEEADSVFYIQQ